MKKSLLFLFVCLSFTVYSQTWAPLGAKWTYDAGWVFAPIPVIDIAVWEVSDTNTFLGKKCSKIERNGLYVDGDYSSYFYTYEENDVFYLYNDSTNAFTTLFDFNKTVGDNWILELGQCQISMKVAKASFDTIGGVLYKSLDIQYDSVNGSANYEMHANRLIGGADRPLPFYDFICTGSIPDGKFYQGLRCYEDSIVGTLNNTLLDCDYTSVGIEETNGTNRFSISPNPGNGDVLIEIDGDIISKRVRIFNSMGSLLNEEIIQQPSTRISIDGPSGLYIIEMMDHEKNVHSIRYILE